MSASPIAPDDPTPLVDVVPSYATFEQLYVETRDALYAYAMGLLRNRESAEDVTAQSYERAYRSRSKIDRARGDARAWLFGIARNTALDELRRRRRQAVPVEPDHVARLAGTDHAADIDGRVALRQALQKLSPRDRELIALKFYAGLNNREIAAVLSESESSVGTRLGRIVNGLRGSL